jgi:hypothetical protein
MTRDQFRVEYCDPRWPGVHSYLIIHRDDACAFMFTTPNTQLSLCRIHAFKPACCRDWSAGTLKDECRSGLKNLLGIEVDDQGQMQLDPHQQRSLTERCQFISNL